MSKVDIVVPCYRYGCFLPQCIGSILDQSMSDFRVLIIDDASPDDSAKVARRLARTDPRVRVIAHRLNRGHIATYNEGIDWAAAPYFLSLSADDFLAPGALRRAVAIMDARPDVVLTYGASIDILNGDPVPELDGAADPAWVVRPGRDFIRETCDTIRNNVPTPTAIVRTDVQKRIGGYLPELYHSGDMEMWMRFAAYGAVAYTPAVQAFYRLHGSNMSTGIYRRVTEDYLQRKGAFDAFFQRHGHRLDDAASLKRLAYRRLGDAAFWTGVAQALRGNRAISRELRMFAGQLNPDTRFWPPFGHLRHLKRADRKVMATLFDLMRRARQS
jgi:glycosyltransferase involved in cell wall biosynthesis